VEPARSSGFAEIVREHQAPLRSFLRRLCWSFDEADDLAQEAFIAAWEQRHRFRGDSTFRSWLFGIAYHKALASGRSRSRRSARETNWAQDQVTTEPPHPEVRIDLQRALGALSEPQMAVVALCWGSDFSHDEAARALDLPIGTVKSHINRARERIRLRLEARDEPD
jgi:RNA polymerase sigma-70 factor (ECF subfamily)